MHGLLNFFSSQLKVQRVVTHFQLWDWPEIGLPSNGSSMMSLVKQSELHRAANGGIIAAHSSSRWVWPGSNYVLPQMNVWWLGKG